MGGTRQVRLDVLSTLLLGAKENRTVREAFMLLSQQPGPVLAYYLSLLALGALAGWGTRAAVRRAKPTKSTLPLPESASSHAPTFHFFLVQCHLFA